METQKSYLEAFKIIIRAIPDDDIQFGSGLLWAIGMIAEACRIAEGEAKFELERRKIETEMLKLGGSRINKWNDPVFITCDGSLDVEWVNNTCGFPQGAILFEKCEDAESAISEIGEDRIKKYIFGVDLCTE